MEQTSTPAAERTHPVHAFAGRAHHALDRVTGSPAWAETPAEQVETLDDLHRLEARLTELRWRVLAAADRNQPGAKHGATSTAAWLSHRTHITRVRANSQLRGALTLDDPQFALTQAACSSPPSSAPARLSAWRVGSLNQPLVVPSWLSRIAKRYFSRARRSSRPPPNAPPWPYETKAAPPKAAPPPGAKPTTTPPGPKAAPPASRQAGSSAPPTTTTTTTTTNTYPSANSASTNGPRRPPVLR